MSTPPLVTQRVLDRATELLALTNQRPQDPAAIRSAARLLHGEAQHAHNRARFALYVMKDGQAERHYQGLSARAGVALPADL